MRKHLRQFILVVLCLLVGAGAALAENIVIKGSTTVLPIAQATLEAYMKANPGTKISLSGGGSGEGIKALIDNSTDIATSSREIKGSEIDTGEIERDQSDGHRRGDRCHRAHRQSEKQGQGSDDRSVEPDLSGQDHELEGGGRGGSADRGDFPGQQFGNFRIVGRAGPEQGQGDAEGADAGLQRRHRADGFKKQVCPGVHRPGIPR